MSDVKSNGKKGKGKNNAAAAANAAATPALDAPQPAAPAASPDALLDLLSSKIDQMEGKDSTGIDESALTPAELTALQTKMANLQASMDAEIAGGKTAQSQISMLLDLYKSEVASRMVYSRLLTDQKDKLDRSLKHKQSLESLCKELQSRNKKLSEDLRHLSTEQVNNHTDMKVRFEANLKDIQTQLNKHSEERAQQAKENDKLRENLAQLLKFDSMREEHCAQQLKTKDLEAKLLEAKLAQQSDFAAAETKKSLESQIALEAAKKIEVTLRAQLQGYSQKFEEVQSTLAKSNDLFASFKTEMERSAAAMKKSESEKMALEKKHSAAQLSLIAQFEERQAERVEFEKMQRQNAVLTSLCKELKNKAAAANTAAAPTTPAAAEESHEKENDSESGAVAVQ